MPERIISNLDLIATVFMSSFALMFSFTIIPILVAVLNGILIISRVKRDVEKYNKGNLWHWFKDVLKKNT